MSSFPQEAGELYNRMLKRFRQEKAVWIKYGAFLLRRGQAGASHRMMQRALECLPKKERECLFPPTGPIPGRSGLSPIWAEGWGSPHPRAGVRKALWSIRGYLSLDCMLMNIARVAF